MKTSPVSRRYEEPEPKPKKSTVTKGIREEIIQQVGVRSISNTNFF
jgi:hypothetical protein